MVMVRLSSDDTISQLIPSHPTRPTMVQVKSGSTILADSDKTVVVEGNHYFPPDSVKKEYFKDSNTHTTCPWKGVASYYNAEVDGKTITDAAWYYPTPKDGASNIKDHIAFYKSKVTIA